MSLRLGIDFGTTHTVVAVVDRGNYPVVSFHSNDGDSHLWYPSLAAARAGECRYGLAALAVAEQPGWEMLRSLKRLLANSPMHHAVTLGGTAWTVEELLTGYFRQLRIDLYQSSNLELQPDEALEVYVSVPANANSNQRFLTLDSFRRAGFNVLGLLNEPAAAGIEYAHRYGLRSNKARYIAVYDLGGGTFDVSVMSMQDRHHQVITTEGITQLGGDDFDQILLDLVSSQVPALKVDSACFDSTCFDSACFDSAQHQQHQQREQHKQQRYRLLEECRLKKESLHPNTKRISLDFSPFGYDPDLSVSTADFYARCTPLITATLEMLDAALNRAASSLGVDKQAIDALYVVGGGSALPAVGRVLREHYGKRVKRSLHAYATTAVGLAISADSNAGYSLQERFTRHFGVWREQEAGRAAIFDPIFPKDTLLPSPGEPPLVYVRRYQPVHNLGHFRYMESSHLDATGLPSGNLSPWGDVLFPFDPALGDVTDLHTIPVQHSAAASTQVIEERYACHWQGILEVTLTNQTSAYARTFSLNPAG